MTDPIISLRGVGKKFVKYDDRRMLVTELLRLHRRTRRSDFWAVRDVDLEIHGGEAVGFLGRNGAGKSTMLQMLAGVTAPSTGVVRVDGRVSPLISVGVGFHPELTGRENVYVNGTILGMSRDAIDRRFDDIVAFAELEQFIDTPVKFYSSGMFVRLGFSVAIEADPDVLLVDEVLAVGDFAFQLKCYERMQEIRSRGTTVIVVSHNLGALRAFCERGIVLHEGRTIFDGPMFDAIGVYHEVMALPVDADDDGAVATGLAEITDARLTRADGSTAAHVVAGEELTFRVTVRAHQDIDHPFASLVIGTEDRNICVYSDSNAREGFPPLRAGEEASYEVRFAAMFPTGSYTAKMGVHRVAPDRQRLRVAAAPAVSFYATGRTMVGGLADLTAAFTKSD